MIQKITKAELQQAIKKSKYRNQKTIAKKLGISEQAFSGNMERASGKFLDKLERLGIDLTRESELKKEIQRLKEIIIEKDIEISELKKRIKNK